MYYHPCQNRRGIKTLKSIISKLLYRNSFQEEHPICKQELCKYIMALLRNRMSLLWWLGGSSSFLSLAFPYLLRCQAWKKSGKILYTDTIAKLQAKDLWGPFFLHNRDHQVSKQKKWGQTGLRDLTHYNVARQNEHCKWVHSAV